MSAEKVIIEFYMPVGFMPACKILSSPNNYTFSGLPGAYVIVSTENEGVFLLKRRENQGLKYAATLVTQRGEIGTHPGLQWITTKESWYPKLFRILVNGGNNYEVEHAYIDESMI